MTITNEIDWLRSNNPCELLLNVRPERAGCHNDPTFGRLYRPLEYRSEQGELLLKVACCRLLLSEQGDICLGKNSFTGEPELLSHAVALAESLAEGGIAQGSPEARRFSAAYPSRVSWPGWPASHVRYIACQLLQDSLRWRIPEWDQFFGRFGGLVPPAQLAAQVREATGNPWHRLLLHRVYVPTGQRAIGGRVMTDAAPEWLTPLAVVLIRQAYAERREDGTLDPSLLGILADALADSGCPHPRLLAELRGLRTCSGCAGSGWDNLVTLSDATAGTRACPACHASNSGRGSGLAVTLTPLFRGQWCLEELRRLLVSLNERRHARPW